MTTTADDQLDTAPFLAWCTRREQQLRRELNHHPAIPGRQDDARARLIAELGWDGNTGMRRLHRWTHTNTGTADRATIENALHHAGLNLHDIYPDQPAPPMPADRTGQGRRMTDRQVINAHTVYTRGRMTMDDVAALIWQHHGYASQESARKGIERAWRSFGLPLRQCAGITLRGTRCPISPISGGDHCHRHTGPCGWVIPTELVARARTMHEGGMFFSQIARTLIDETPWTHPDHLADHLRRIAERDGWHRTTHYGQPRKWPVSAVELEQAA